MNFNDPNFASRFRDVIQKAVAIEIDKKRPPKRYGIVQSTDRDARQVMVVLNGDVDAVPVSYGSITVPLVSGLMVRVGGTTSDRYVEEVIGGGDGLWRKYDATLANNWNVGGDGRIDVRYTLTGKTCTVAWRALFIGTAEVPISTGAIGSDFGIEMPFMCEGTGLQYPGTAFVYNLFSVWNMVSRFESAASPQYIVLGGTDAPAGVKNSDPVVVTDYISMHGTVTYEISLYHLYLFLTLVGSLPGTVV
jgi:hypothetical protein